MIRILIVDDQHAVREVLDSKLSEEVDFQVVGKAVDGLQAKSLIEDLNPDVVTLDVNMPNLDGISLLKTVHSYKKIPMIMLSSYTDEGTKSTLEALRFGAYDFVHKPDGSAQDFNRMLNELKEKIREAYNSIHSNNLTDRQSQVANFIKTNSSISLRTHTKIRFIALGSSTGGTQAIESILKDLPNNTPGILIVQHMPSHFTKLFAERLDSEVSMKVKEAEDGDTIEIGKVLIAPGDRHMSIGKFSPMSPLSVRVYDGERVSGHRPSVNVLFRSIAESGLAESVLGVILTGMGKDGAIGMEMMKANGSYNIGQDEETSVVFGMPKEAWEVGAVDELLPLHRIASRIIELTQIEN
jgi:two-component system, chemotaxis family, protein-glutamate methylesterase/glutaminase